MKTKPDESTPSPPREAADQPASARSIVWARRRRALSGFWRQYRRSPMGVWGLAIMGAFAFMARPGYGQAAVDCRLETFTHRVVTDVAQVEGIAPLQAAECDHPS